MQNWEAMLVRPDSTIVEAIKIIDSGGGQIAIIVDDDRHLVGVFTDADVRKAIVRNVPLDGPCSAVMTSTPIVLNVNSSRGERLELMRRRHVRQLPLVDDDNRLVDVVLLMDLVAPEPLPNPVVLMAGGLGSRLGELTHDTPKPLLHVGDRPLLETILLQLVEQGFERFFLSVNYKAEMIVEHFGDGSQWGVDIRYLHERERLGTAGALHLLPEGISENVLVMNGDILTKVDLRHMLTTHKVSEASLTMAVKDYALKVPYGVVDVDSQSTILSFREKPSHRFFVNAGIYVISPQLLPKIPSNRYFDMPSLFELLKRDGQKMSAFPIREYWLDIGQPKDYEQANIEYEIHFP